MWATPKLQTLSAISRDVAQVLFASVFITPIVSGDLSILKMGGGFLLSIFFWWLSVLFISE